MIQGYCSRATCAPRRYERKRNYCLLCCCVGEEAFGQFFFSLVAHFVYVSVPRLRSASSIVGQLDGVAAANFRFLYLR